MGYSSWGGKELDSTERLSTAPFSHTTLLKRMEGSGGNESSAGRLHCCLHLGFDGVLLLHKGLPTFLILFRYFTNTVGVGRETGWNFRPHGTHWPRADSD